MKKIMTSLCAAFLLVGVGCSDDDDDTCECQLTFATINGTDARQVSTLSAADDRNTSMVGLQIDVEVTSTCLQDGEQLTLSGGTADAVATVTGNTALFSQYTIAMSGQVTLTVEGPEQCAGDIKSVMVETLPFCEILGVEDGGQYDCLTPGDDEDVAQVGLQRNITVSCVGVPDGASVDLSVDGVSEGIQTLSTGVALYSGVTLPAFAGQCSTNLEVSATVTSGSDVYEDTVTVAEVCCDSPPCTVHAFSPSDPVPTAMHQSTFNIAADADTFTAGLQTAVTIQTDGSRVERVGLLVNGDVVATADTNSQNSVTIAADHLTLPEGDITYQPVCYLADQTDYFSYSSEIEDAYVDSVPPECPTDVVCEVSNPRLISIDCTWTAPDDPGATLDINSWDVRYSNGYGQVACEDATDLESEWASWKPFPSTSPISPAQQGQTVNTTAEELLAGLNYCVAVRTEDYAGNVSDCTSNASFATGGEIRQQHLSNCTTPPCSFGSAFDTADVNCDGYRDLIVGAYNDVGYMGKAYIYFGNPLGLSNTPDVEIVADRYGSLGWSITRLGNFVGHTGSEADCEDFAISMLYWDEQSTDCGGASCYSGAVHIFRGRLTWNAQYGVDGANGPDASLIYDLAGRPGQEEFGRRIALAGNVNNDQYPDLIISSPKARPSGAVYVFLGGHSIPLNSGSPTVFHAPADMDIVISGNTDFASCETVEWLGFSLSRAGDLNGDGFDDFLIGAPGDIACADKLPGAAYVIFGAAHSGTQQSIDLSATGSRWSRISEDSHGNVVGTSSIGWAVAGLGDVNSDGSLDIAVSDIDYSNLDASPVIEEKVGAVFVFLGDADGFESDRQVDEADIWIRSAGGEEDQLGYSLTPSVQVMGSNVGDFNGDGLSDMFVGMLKYGSQPGSVAFLYGDPALPSLGTWVNLIDIASFIIPPPSACGDWGYFVAYLGDINGDGFVDVGIGDSAYAVLPPCSEAQVRGRMTIVY